MYDVPLDERVYDKFSAKFQCPNCKCWLQADKKLKILSNLGLSLIAVSSIVATLNVMSLTDVDFLVLFLLAVIGILSFSYSLWNIKLKMVE